MCGLAGIVPARGRAAAVSDLERMLRAIRHRGPEGSFFARGKGEPRPLFGFLRLGFTDIVSGHQPLHNEDGSLMAVVNGEFYDHEQIRRDLERRGHRFATKSDSELIPHLYEERGLDLFGALNGEFAFALWDGARSRLVLARDRFGIKPMFYARDPERGLVFASECKAILALPGFRRAIDPDYFTGPGYGSVETSRTLFAGISSVRPGHVLTFHDGQIREEPYWTPGFSDGEAPPRFTYREAQEELRGRMVRAVRRRQQAEVPVGVTLSGGVDSTIVAALAAREAGSSSKIPAFHVGFSDRVYDESPIAVASAEKLGLDLQVVRCGPEDLADHYLQAAFHSETLITDLASAARFLLARQVRASGFKAVMSGEGADELFGGYSYFKLEQLWRKWSAGGDAKAQADTRWKQFQKDEARSQGLFWDKRLPWKRTADRLGAPMHYSVRLEKNDNNRKKVFSSDFWERTREQSLWQSVDSEFGVERLRRLTPFDKARLISRGVFASYIAPTLGDRMEMSHSLEGRAPFLDTEVLDLAYGLPEAYCVDWERFREKSIVHDAFADLLPPEVAAVGKHPFVSPRWKSCARHPRGKALLRSLTSRDAVRRAGVFKPSFVAFLRGAWSLVPAGTSLGRQLDVAMGFVASIQGLHRVFVEELDSYVGSAPLAHPLVERSAA